MPPSVDTPNEFATVVVAVIVALGTIVGGVVAAIALGIAWWRSHVGPLLKGTAADAAKARKEVSANHGSSMRDSVARVEVAIVGLTEDVRTLRAEARNDTREVRDRADRAHSEIFQRLYDLEQRHNKEHHT